MGEGSDGYQSVPEPDLSDHDLDRAVEIWKEPTAYGHEEIRQALSIVRVWHADRADLLRRTQRGTPAYNEIKREEELLEVYLTDLKDALITTLHHNRLTGGNS